MNSMRAEPGVFFKGLQKRKDNEQEVNQKVNFKRTPLFLLASSGIPCQKQKVKNKKLNLFLKMSNMWAELNPKYATEARI